MFLFCNQAISLKTALFLIISLNKLNLHSTTVKFRTKPNPCNRRNSWTHRFGAGYYQDSPSLIKPPDFETQVFRISLNNFQETVQSQLSREVPG